MNSTGYKVKFTKQKKIHDVFGASDLVLSAELNKSQSE